MANNPCTEPGCPQCASVVHPAVTVPTVVNAPATVTNGAPRVLPGSNAPTTSSPTHWTPDATLPHDWTHTD